MSDGTSNAAAQIRSRGFATAGSEAAAAAGFRCVLTYGHEEVRVHEIVVSEVVLAGRIQRDVRAW